MRGDENDAIFRDPMCARVPRETIEAFLAAWAIYPPRRGGNPRRMALRAWLARVHEEVSLADLHTATVHYRKYCENAEACGTPYVLHGATFYGPNERWKDFLAPLPDREADELIVEVRESWIRGGLKS